MDGFVIWIQKNWKVLLLIIILIVVCFVVIPLAYKWYKKKMQQY